MKGNRLWYFWTILITTGFALPVHAEDGHGWIFSGRLQGSSNSSGFVMKADPSVGYSFSRHFQTNVGLPVYFVNENSTTQTTSAFMNGLATPMLGFISEWITQP